MVMDVLQASCSELILVVPRELAAEVLRRAKDLAVEIGAEIHDKLWGGRPVDPGALILHETGDEIRYAAAPDAEMSAGVVLGGARLDLAWDRRTGRIYYHEHYSRELFPLLARLASEFGLEVCGHDGGRVDGFAGWAEENGYEVYREDSNCVSLA